VNASLDVNPNFPFQFLPGSILELAIGISIKVSDRLVAISDSFGASQTAIFTFFGQSTPIMSQDMYAYEPFEAIPTFNYPFVVQVRLPPSCYYLSSQPPLTQYFEEQGERWTMFTLNFPRTTEAIYAQTLLCNFADPAGQSSRELWIFLAGVFVTILVSFIIEAISEFNKTRTEQALKDQIATYPRSQGATLLC
jgi:hypothetical protein